MDDSPRPTLRLASDLAERPDEELMTAYRNGDVAAFDVLVHRHRNRVFGFLRRMGWTGARAEELVADVFLKIHRAAPRYEPTARFTTWLYTVTYRASLNARDKAAHQLDRSVGGDAELDLHGRSHAPSPERRLAASQALAVIDRELATLPETHRAAFVLYYREGLSCSELAAALDITPAEAKGRLAYARKLLRSRLEPLLAERRS